MAKSTYSAPIGDLYGENVATATALAYGDVISVRRQYKGVHIHCASDYKVLHTPRIAKVLLWDDSEKKFSNQTIAAVDRDSDTEVELGTMTTSDILYVGAVDTFLGLAIDIGTANTNGSTTPPDVEYWTVDGWKDVSNDLDGTLSSSTSFAVDGLYTWDLPSDWVPTSVNGSVPLYYVSFKPLANLSALTTLDGLTTIHKGTNYARFPAGSSQTYNWDEDKVGGLQFLAASGTPTVYINWIEYKG